MIRLVLSLLGVLRRSRQKSVQPAAGPAPVWAGQAAGGWASHQQGAPGQAPAPPPPGGPPPGAVPQQWPWTGQTTPVPAGAPGFPGGPGVPGGQPPRPRRRVRRWAIVLSMLAVAGLVFRRALASLVLAGLAAGLHIIGVNVHLPSVRFAWPWQALPTTTNTDLGPWVLQKIQGISRPALGRASFDFVFTHRVSKNIGPWPCWYASTFYAVGHASATVDLNPGRAWWAPARDHYRLRILSRPTGGRPGHVTVMMVLPRPALPASAHDVTIDDIPSRPLSVQHSWTYPGLGCGAVIRPQFPQSVLYAQAQRIAFYKATHAPQVTRPLIASAEAQAQQTIRDNFIQPTVNAFGYKLDSLTIRWTQ